MIPSAASKVTAKTCILKMAKRLKNSPHLKKVVEDSIEKLLPNPDLKSNHTWFLPAVLSERKGKHRFCLDGAANSMLLTGEGPKMLAVMIILLVATLLPAFIKFSFLQKIRMP